MKNILLAATAIAFLAGMAPMAQAQNAGTSAPQGPQAAPSFPAKAAPAASVATPAPSSVKKKHAKRIPLQQRFDTANTSHDGHLTLTQATAANWGYVKKHFDVMDTGHKGYVTVADIHAYGSAQHAARVKRKAATPASPATTK